MKKRAKLLLVSLLVLTSLLLFVGCGGNADNSSTNETSTETQAPESTNETETTTTGDQEASTETDSNVVASAGDPAKGQAFYDESGCSGCHAINGEGGTSSAELTTIGSKYDAESLKTYLTGDHPVAISGSEEDIANLVAYLVSLK